MVWLEPEILLSFGLTKRIRSAWNIDGSVNYSSGAYRGGELAGVGVSIGAGAGLFAGSVRVGNTVRVTRWRASGGEWIIVGEKSTSNWWLSGTRFRYPYSSATTMRVPSSQLSYHPDWEKVKGLIEQRAIKQ